LTAGVSGWHSPLTMAKLRAVLFGATGLAGQQFVAALAAHPWFELAAVAASPRNAGRRYAEALAEGGWFLPEPIPQAAASLTLLAPSAVEASDFDLAFSAVEADVARELEPRAAGAIPVFSTASAFRYEADVPLLLPPVNGSHLQLVRTQRTRGFRGYLAPIPNCVATGLAVPLAPLVERFGVQAVVMTSLQSVSGAGRSPGVLALEVLDNVVPYIAKEEGKVEVETRKILGRWSPGQPQVEAHSMRISATCTRVAVLEGHTVSASVSLGRSASLDEVRQALSDWRGDATARDLPSTPPRWIEVLDAVDRPQPRLDRETHNGMATVVGRLREDSVLANGVKFVLLSHNTKLGAAKGAVLVAELAKSQGLL
jgi:aspartate-semialdehyde dehydrogenase